jgi:DNA primase
MSHLDSFGLAAESAQALSATPVPLPACAAPDAMPAEAGAGWWHFFGLMNPGRLDAEVAAAVAELAQRGDATAERRLRALSIARDRQRRGEHYAPDSAGLDDAGDN